MSKLYEDLKVAFMVIPPSKRGRIKFIIAAATLGIFIELLGLGFLISAIKVITEDRSFATMPLVGTALAYFSFATGINVVVAGMISLLVIYFVKSAYLTFLLAYQTNFAYQIQEILSSELFKVYLRWPHEKEKRSTTTTQIRNIITEIPVYVTNVLIYSLQLLSELIPLIATAIFLLYIDFFGTLISAIASVSLAAIYHRITKNRIARLGATRQSAEEERIREINHSLISKKELLIYSISDKCIQRFDKVNNQLCQTAFTQSVIQQLPRYWFEFIAIFAIIVLSHHLSFSVEKKEDMLVVIGVFAFGAFKLLPSVNRILLCTQAIRYGMPSAQLLHNELKDNYHIPTSEADSQIEVFRSLKIDNLSFKYPHANRNVITNLNCEINNGEWVAIVGSSGSGKSTLLNLLLGLLKPTEGSILLNGMDIQRVEKSSYYNIIGYVPQEVFIYDDTIANNITYWDSEVAVDRLNLAINNSRLQEVLINKYLAADAPLSERGENISGGQRQRIALARALYRMPQVLILDEATSGLDERTEREVLEAIKNNQSLDGVTLISITHSMKCIGMFDQVIELTHA